MRTWVYIEKKNATMPTSYDSAASVPDTDWRVTMEAQDERSVHSNSTPNQGALTGLRVIELADEQAEYCGLALAGLGAEVVKVEPPGGSPTRRIGPFYEDREDSERSLFFWQYNRGKRSISARSAPAARPGPVPRPRCHGRRAAGVHAEGRAGRVGIECGRRSAQGSFPR